MLGQTLYYCNEAGAILSKLRSGHPHEVLALISQILQMVYIYWVRLWQSLSLTPGLLVALYSFLLNSPRKPWKGNHWGNFFFFFAITYHITGFRSHWVQLLPPGRTIYQWFLASANPFYFKIFQKESVLWSPSEKPRIKRKAFCMDPALFQNFKKIKMPLWVYIMPLMNTKIL